MVYLVVCMYMGADAHHDTERDSEMQCVCNVPKWVGLLCLNRQQPLGCGMYLILDAVNHTDKPYRTDRGEASGWRHQLVAHY